MANNYNEMELMITIAARELTDGVTVAVGTGTPLAAAMLAKRTFAPNLVILFEAGGISPKLKDMPISVGDSRSFYKAAMVGSMGDIMEPCSRGLVDYTFLGGAQIDRYGNLNSTMIGEDHAKPKVRFPGSGGANDFASFCWRTMVITPQDKRRFVEKLDFCTSPGYLTGGNAREAAGLPEDTGPYRIITNTAVMDFEEETKQMRVISVNPGYCFEDVQKNCGFELLKADEIKETLPPTKEELCILREQIDPQRLIIGK